ncbi:MAG: lipoate--protein ligase family protein [Anaerolineaceae bacterium]|nr:lipoate--protein ligase family protein [Anaerolineaceae bacterium]
MATAEQETPRWRLIIDSAHGGAANMARDEALRESVRANAAKMAAATPILRLYGWQPPCLSLGYGQRARLVDDERCRARGWQVVRRPSGGGALLHADELTYCLLLPPGHPLQQGDILSSYARLRRGLVAGLARLGVCADAAPADAVAVESAAPNRSEAICYLQPAAQEITVGGRKLIGSAQLRRRGVLLQHGSLPLAADLTAIADALHFNAEAERTVAKEELRRGACSLGEILGGSLPSWSEAAAALAAGFAAVFGIRWDERPFSAAEETRAREWAETRYATAAWTERR